MSAQAVEAGRAVEVADKLRLLRAALAQAGAGAIRLRGLDWLAWATAGADAGLSLAADCGVAELLVTVDEACVLTDAIDAERLRAEQLPDGFSFHIAPWADTELRETYVLGAAGGAVVLSDRPRADEAALPSALRLRRMVLGEAERQRYRALGQEAAAAVGEALRAARPGWTEYELAAAAARALLARGIQPALLLAAGERRLPLYPHPLPTHERLGGRALLACCARRHGLYANLTRCRSFGPLPDALRGAQQELLQAEATGLDAVRPGQSLSAVYHALDAAYRHANRPEAILEQRQGGITGYAAREIETGPSTATGLEPGMAFAFHPGFAGLRIEDTFLLGPGGLENLTPDPLWPAANVNGRARPLWLEEE